MWRYLFGLPRARIQWCGTWRSTTPSSYRDDQSEVSAAQTAVNCHRLQCLRSKTYGDDKWHGRGTDYHKRFYCSFNNLGDAVFISSTFLLTCHVSEFWRAHQDVQARKRKLLVLDSLRRELHRLRFTLHVLNTPAPPKLKRDVSWAKTVPVPSDTDEEPSILDLRKVRFDLEFSGVGTVASHEDQEQSAPADKHEQYYAEFEENWKDLCAMYDKMKCNRKGVLAIEGGNYGQAMSHFETAGSAGCAKAFFNLAVMYETGIGYSKDIHQAINLYQKAMLHGNAEAAHNLALLYLNRRFPGDDTRAVEMLTQASSHGLTRSKTNLGVLCIEQGKMEEATKLFTEATEKEDVDAMYFLGVCYETGMGVEKNECKAAELYRKAAAAEHDHAQYSLAVFFEKGLGGLPINKKSAIELYEKSAEAGNTEAKERLCNLKEIEENSDTTELAIDIQNIRISTSSPAIVSYLQNHLLQLNHSDWELNVNSLQKSATHTGALKHQHNDKLGIDSDDMRSEIVKYVNDEKNAVAFTLGDDRDYEEDSLSDWSNEDIPDSGVLDGGCDTFTNLSLITTKFGYERSKATSELFVVDRGFGCNLPNFSKAFVKTGLDKKESKNSLFSFGSDSNFSIAFDENCSSAKLLTVSDNSVKGRFGSYDITGKTQIEAK